MKRIKTSNLIIILIFLLIISYLTFVALYGYLAIKNYHQQNSKELNTHTFDNLISLPKFNTIVINGHKSILIKNDSSNSISFSSNADFEIKNDTLWLKNSAIVSTANLKTLITHEDPRIRLKNFNQSKLNIYAKDNASISIDESKISFVNANFEDKSDFSIKNSQIQSIKLTLKDKAHASLLIPIDTLAGYTEKKTKLILNKVNFKNIDINGYVSEIGNGFYFKF